MGYDTRYNLRWDAEDALSMREVCISIAPAFLGCDASRYDMLKECKPLLDVSKRDWEKLQDLQRELVWVQEVLLGGDTVKWYEYHTDMLNLSAAYPDVAFFLTGVGEENGDQWRACYYGGEGERVNGVMTFPEFTKMQEHFKKFM